ncbi:MAG: protein translocase subunit SecF [Bacteroidetes bacterium]|nr:protein translocase subunit SecF [Bacteroidota bacterium]
MKILEKTHIDFMGTRKIWYSISAAVIIIGIIGAFVRGVSFGIDFLGGTELLVRFDNPPAISEIRDAVQKAGFTSSEIKVFGSPNDILIRTAEQTKGTATLDAIRQQLTSQFPSNPYTILKEDKIGPKIGAELRTNAIYAIFSAMLIIMIYVGFRFQFIYGVAGVVALFHDVIATFGVIVLLNGLSPYLNLEIDQNIMAAFLTLVGFSINDTVVIFDRVRENLKIHKAEDLSTIINRSVNETLSRSIITNGTVFMVLIVLVIFGGEVNRGFAFTFFIGTILGTYSTIYVASALVLDFTKRQAIK